MSEFFRKPIVKTLMLKGQEGQSIKGITKTNTSGLVDTYTITLTDGTTSTFTVTNGKEISSISKTGTSGLVDTYTITFNDGTNSTFTVTNGKGISNIRKTGTDGLVDTYTITFNDGTTSTFTVTNGDSAYKPAVEALGKRIDNLILSSGTESSAEVVDARTGYDGTSYDTLGTAIRTQASELKGELDEVEKSTYCVGNAIYTNDKVVGYRLLEDGTSIEDEGYKIVYFNVQDMKVLYLDIESGTDDLIQFRTDLSITTRIKTIINKNGNYISIPQGTKYAVLSMLVTNDLKGVYAVKSEPKDIRNIIEKYDDNFVNVGICHSTRYDIGMDVYAKSNFRNVRFSILWEKVETEEGVYDFSNYDDLVNECVQNNLQPIIIISCVTPVSFYGDTKAPITETQIKAFKKFLLNVVKHYADKKYRIIYEFWNEPNLSKNWEGTANDYATVAKVFCNIIHQYDLRSCASVGVVYLDSFIFDIIKLGAFDNADYADLHTYIPNEIEYNQERMLNRIRMAFIKYNLPNIPFIISEVGYSTVPNWNGAGNSAVVSEEERSDFIQKLIILSAKYNIKYLCVYTSVTEETNEEDVEHWFGIYRKDTFEETETAISLRELLKVMNNTTFVGEYYEKENKDYIYIFYNISDRKYILFSWTLRTPHTKLINGKVITFYNTISRYILEDFPRNMTIKTNYVTNAFMYMMPFLYQYPMGVSVWENGINNANAYYSFACGYNNNANYNYSSSFGVSSTAGRTAQMVCGTHNEIDTEALLVVGCGTNDNTRKNGFCVYDNRIKINDTMLTEDEIKKIKELIS